LVDTCAAVRREGIGDVARCYAATTRACARACARACHGCRSGEPELVGSQPMDVLGPDRSSQQARGRSCARGSARRPLHDVAARSDQLAQVGPDSRSRLPRLSARGPRHLQRSHATWDRSPVLPSSSSPWPRGALHRIGRSPWPGGGHAPRSPPGDSRQRQRARRFARLEHGAEPMGRRALAQGGLSPNVFAVPRRPAGRRATVDQPRSSTTLEIQCRESPSRGAQGMPGCDRLCRYDPAGCRRARPVYAVA
jgi:hypothetical protein